MSAPFILQLIITFFIGSLWIFLTLLACHRLGSKMGGFIGGLPSTALLSFFFIGFTQSPQVASHATTQFPLAMGITSMFLVFFALSSRWGFGTAMGISIGGWFILTAIVIWINPINFFYIILVYILILAASYYILERRLKISSHPRSSIRESIWQTVLKSFFGGTIITAAVLLAKAGGPSIGGVFAAFPAMFISTLTMTHNLYGLEFSRSLTKSLMVTGMFTIVIYVMGVRYLYPPCGLWAGTIISLCISAFSAYLTYLFIQKKLS